jgi:hypothetical protein
MIKGKLTLGLCLVCNDLLVDIIKFEAGRREETAYLKPTTSHKSRNMFPCPLGKIDYGTGIT